jgi:outer membrane protein OmpA-like peptidoglycan-associated protein
MALFRLFPLPSTGSLLLLVYLSTIMKYCRLIALGFLLFKWGAFSVCGQDSIQFRLFFQSNEDRVPEHKNQLRNFLGPYASSPLIINTSGYADFIGDAMENFHLSRRRADIIYSEVLQLKAASQAPWVVLSPSFFGESLSKENGSPRGDSLNRVVVLTLLIKKNPAQPDIPSPQPSRPAQTPAVPPSFEELKAKGRIDLPGVNFIPGRDILVSGATVGLDTLAAQLSRNPEVKIEIRGHVCCTKGTRDGDDLATGLSNLSEMRAEAVARYLQGKGIATSRMTARGMAHKEPRYPGERNPEEQQGNRRVEILIVK